MSWNIYIFLFYDNKIKRNIQSNMPDCLILSEMIINISVYFFIFGGGTLFFIQIRSGPDSCLWEQFIYSTLLS